MRQRTYFSRTVLVGLSVVILIFSATLAYYLRDLLLSPDRLSSVTGPQEGYYWTAAQYQIAHLQFQKQAVMYALGTDADVSKLRLRYAILQSKFKVLAYPSELTHFFRNIPSYDASINQLKELMMHLGRNMEVIEHDHRAAQLLSDAMQDGWRPAATIANDTRAVEMQSREYAFADFYAKRRLIYINVVILLILFAVTIIVLLAAFRRQRLALNMEQQAVQAKNAFLAVVSHELRTPLQSITAAVDVLIDDGMASRHSKLLGRMESATRQLEVQMKDLTDYVKLEAGGLALLRKPFMLSQIVEMTINDVLPFAERKGLALECTEFPKNTWYVSDPLRIMQILSNLLTNAIKYTEQGGVSVQVDCDCVIDGRNTLVFRIVDTGQGIPQQKLAAVFEPFMQLDQSSTRCHNGIGMGLTIAKGLVGLLGGTITVDSKLGQGTVFCVVIPAEAHSAVVSEANTSPWSGTPHVLVVENNESAREAFSLLLDKLHVKHDMACDAMSATQFLNQQDYDAVLLDIDMPVKDGATLAREIREGFGINRHVPIIAVSAHVAEIDCPETVELFDIFLPKPIRLGALRETLCEILRKVSRNE